MIPIAALVGVMFMWLLLELSHANTFKIWNKNSIIGCDCHFISDRTRRSYLLDLAIAVIAGVIGLSCIGFCMGKRSTY